MHSTHRILLIITAVVIITLSTILIIKNRKKNEKLTNCGIVGVNDYRSIFPAESPFVQGRLKQLSSNMQSSLYGSNIVQKSSNTDKDIVLIALKYSQINNINSIQLLNGSNINLVKSFEKKDGVSSDGGRLVYFVISMDKGTFNQVKTYKLMYSSNLEDVIPNSFMIGEKGKAFSQLEDAYISVNASERSVSFIKADMTSGVNISFPTRGKSTGKFAINEIQITNKNKQLISYNVSVSNSMSVENINNIKDADIRTQSIIKSLPVTYNLSFTNGSQIIRSISISASEDLAPFTVTFGSIKYTVNEANFNNETSQYIISLYSPKLISSDGDIQAMLIELNNMVDKTSQPTPNFIQNQIASINNLGSETKKISTQIVSSSFKKPCLDNKVTVYAGCENFVYGNKEQALKQCSNENSFIEYTLITKDIPEEDPCLLKRSFPIILSNCIDNQTGKSKAYFTDKAMQDDGCINNSTRIVEWIGDGIEYKNVSTNFESTIFDNFVQNINKNIVPIMTTLDNLTFFPEGVTPQQVYESYNNMDKLFYKISIAGLMFVYGLGANDEKYTKLSKDAKDFLYAIYLLSPAQSYQYVYDGEKEYSISDLYYKIFDSSYTNDGVNLWKKIITFNYNNDIFKSFSNLIKYEYQDLTRTPKLGLITKSFISPMNFYKIRNLYYYRIILNNIVGINQLNGIMYVQNIGDLSYVFGIMDGGNDDKKQNIFLSNANNLITQLNPLIYDITKINSQNDIKYYVNSRFETSDENYSIISSLVGRYILKYIAMPSPEF